MRTQRRKKGWGRGKRVEGEMRGKGKGGVRRKVGKWGIVWKITLGALCYLHSLFLSTTSILSFFFQPNHPLYNFSLKEYTHAYLFSFPFSEYHISIREIYIQNRYMLFQKDINKVKIVDIVNTSLSPYAC